VPRLLASLFLACPVLSACGPGRPPGVAKGCEARVNFGQPIVDGLGLSSHIEWGSSAEETARRSQEIEMWQELGPSLIRRDLFWDELEPQPAEWSLAPVDRLLEATQTADVKLVALLNYGNPVYPPFAEERAHPVDDPADFARYASTIAERFGEQLELYEIWNEPNAGLAFWKPREDPVAYAALLSAAVPALRAADPDAVIALGGLFWPDLVVNTPGPEFLASLLDLLPDLAGVDSVSIHPYRYPFSVPEAVLDHQGSLVDEICGARAQLDEAGLESTELWVGELGWHTAPDAFAPGLSREDQASVLVRAALLSFAQGARQFVWYTTRDSGTDLQDQEQMFGIVGYDPDPLDGDQAERKPAFAAFKVLSQMLGKQTTIEDLSGDLRLDEETYGYRLSGGGVPIDVYWTSGESSVLDLLVGGSAVVMTQIDGESEYRPSSGRLPLEIGPSPIFVQAVY
jgi:hypothetical protein